MPLLFSIDVGAAHILQRAAALRARAEAQPSRQLQEQIGMIAAFYEELAWLLVANSVH